MRLMTLMLVLLSGCSCVSKLNSPAIEIGSKAQVAAPTKVAEARKPDLNGAIPVGEINAKTEGEVTSMLNGLANAGAKTITMVINSNGGEMARAFRIIDRMEALQKNGIKLRCIGDRNVKSAALTILLACDEKLATKRTTFMEHEISYSGVSGNARLLRRLADELDVDNKAFFEILGSKLKIGPKGVQDKLANDKEWDFAWEEAIAVGAITGTIEPQAIPYLYEMPKPNVSDLLRMMEDMD